MCWKMNFSLILREPLLDQNQTLCDSLKTQVNMFGSSPSQEGKNLPDPAPADDRPSLVLKENGALLALPGGPQKPPRNMRGDKSEGTTFKVEESSWEIPR